VKDFITATGKLSRYVSADTDDGAELYGLLRTAMKFIEQQGKGRGEGFFKKFVIKVCKRLPELTFEKLIQELELEAVRRQRGSVTPISRVDRTRGGRAWFYHRGEEDFRRFKTLRNYMTDAKAQLKKEAK
jgi:hypothetical protein